MDPPRHDVVRRLIAGRFRPAAAAELEESTRTNAGELLSQVQDTTLDVSRDFAQRLTALTMCRQLGLPAATIDAASGLAVQVVFPGADRAAATSARMRARSQLADLFLTLVPSGKTSRQSVIGDLAAALDRGAIALNEVPGLCLMLVVAGMEPTTSLLTSIVHALATSRLGTDQICDADGRVSSGVINEFLRYDTPVQWVSRITTREVGVHSGVIPAGQRVLLLLASANRDPRRYEHPDEFDPRRSGGNGASFGFGMHACLGVPLARVQTRIALEVLLGRKLNLRLTGPTRRSPSHVLRGFESLPIDLS